MKKFIVLLAVVLFAIGISVPVKAETDYVALKLIQMMLDGDEGSYKGVTPVFKKLRSTGKAETTSGVGTANAATTVVEYGDGVTHQTVITADDLTVNIAYPGGATNGYGSVKLYDFPEGRILVEGVTIADVTITVDTNSLDNADGGDYALGTVAANDTSGLASTEVDLCPSTSVDAITNVVSSALAASAQFDGTTTAKDLYFNCEIDSGDMTAGATNTVDFTATITWKNLGDY